MRSRRSPYMYTLVQIYTREISTSTMRVSIVQQEAAVVVFLSFSLSCLLARTDVYPTIWTAGRARGANSPGHAFPYVFDESIPLSLPFSRSFPVSLSLSLSLSLPLSLSLSLPPRVGCQAIRVPLRNSRPRLHVCVQCERARKLERVHARRDLYSRRIVC